MAKNYTGINSGKICKVELIEKLYIEDMVINPETNEVYISYLPSAQYTELPYTKETAELQVTPGGDDDGSRQFMQIGLECEVPKVAALSIMGLETWKCTKLIARITDIEGAYYIIGTIKAPAQLTYNYGIGKKPADNNSHQVAISAPSLYGLLKEVIL